jgi:hypothetical protein
MEVNMAGFQDQKRSDSGAPVIARREDSEVTEVNRDMSFEARRGRGSKFIDRYKKTLAEMSA